MANQLIVKRDDVEKPRIVTKEMLDEAAERYNQLNWVREAGRHYFVGKEVKGDGTFVHYLDCTGGCLEGVWGNR